MVTGSNEKKEEDKTDFEKYLENNLQDNLLLISVDASKGKSGKLNIDKIKHLQDFKDNNPKQVFINETFRGGRKTKRIRRYKSKRRSTNKARPRSRKAGPRKAKR